MTGPYDDIIHLPHHISATRPRMAAMDRAAQFSPFAALTGHDAAIKETARRTDQQIELAEDARTVLDIKLNMLRDMATTHPEVAVTYFQPDEHKEGGHYVTATGAVKKVDGYTHMIVMMNGTEIPIEHVLALEGELFKDLL